MAETSKHLRYIEMCAKIAHTVRYVQKFGVIIVKGGRILAKGKNNYETCRHAEINAIGKNWASNLKDSTIYIVRIRKEQPFGLAKPCPKCEEIIRECGIRDIVYTTNDPINTFVKERW